jgi:HAD superfamily hydrolase (TIGR01509 family)
MIKLIIFDLDGVLVDAKNIHFKTLNKSLGDYQITWDEHIIKYDGLKTKQKLELLHKEKGLPIELFDKVWSDKQKYTLESLKDLKESPHLSECIDLLISDGYKLAVCSNSVRKTVLTVLSKLNIIDKFDLILSNEDVINSKPHPEIYWKTISKMGCLPDETVIIEDSPYGLLSAHRTNSQVFRVTSPKDVTYSNIKNFISSLKKKPKPHNGSIKN